MGVFNRILDKVLFWREAEPEVGDFTVNGCFTLPAEENPSTETDQVVDLTETDGSDACAPPVEPVGADGADGAEIDETGTERG